MTALLSSASGGLLEDVERLRADFPILARTVRGGKPLVYLDSGATSQKPRQVLDAERAFYEQHNAAPHRGAHQLAEEATEAYEGARSRIAGFVGADPQDLVFTKNATEALNLVAYAFSNAATAGDYAARFRIGPGDEVVVTEMEHHANLVPWQELCRRTGATLRWFGVTDEGRLELADLDALVNERTKVVALTHQSNVLGTVNPLGAITARAHAVGAVVVLDACQSVPHLPVDLTAAGGRLRRLLRPQDAGSDGDRGAVGPARAACGDAPVHHRRLHDRDRADGGLDVGAAPAAVRGGVPMAAQAVGLAAAVDYLQAVGMDRVRDHETALTALALEALAEIPGVRVIGPPDNVDRGGAVSFAVEDIHPHDVGQVLDDLGVEVRVGHHCAWPLMRRFGVPATTRATFALYTTPAEIEALAAGVRHAQRFFGVA